MGLTNFILSLNYASQSVSPEPGLSIVSLSPIAPMDVYEGVPFEELELPETVQANISDGSSATVAITWIEGEYLETVGEYTLAGTITPPSGVSVSFQASIDVDVVALTMPQVQMRAIIEDDFVWLHSQDINIADTDEYDSGVKLWTDRLNGLTAVQATATNRPTITTNTINGYTNKQRIVFDGADNFLQTNFTGSAFATNTNGFEIHLWIGGVADGIITTTRYFLGAQNPSGTDSRMTLFIPGNNGRINFSIGNEINNAFARASTSSNVFADGVNNKTYIRVRVDYVTDVISIYAIVPDADFINDITTPLALDAGQTLPLSAITPGNFDLLHNIYIGALNSGGTATGFLGFDLMDILFTPLLSNDQANELCNYIVNFETEKVDSTDITSTEGEVVYIDKIGSTYNVICRHFHTDPQPSDYPSDLFTSADLLDTATPNAGNPVFDIGVIYSYFRAILKRNGTYIGVYTTKDEVMGVPVSKQENVGIATSTDLETWTDLGIVLDHDALSLTRIFGGQIRYEDGFYYMLTQIPEVDDDTNDQYRIDLYSAPENDLTDWTWVKTLVDNNGTSSGAMSQLQPGAWFKYKGLWFLFFVDAFGGPASGVRLATSPTIDGTYTVMDGYVMQDKWIGHPITPGGGSGEETNINFHYIYDQEAPNFYQFYNIRDQSQALIPHVVRRVPITLP